MTRPTPPDRPSAGTLVIREGRIVFATDGAGALTGRAAAALVGTPVLDLVAPEDRSRVADRYERRVRGEPVPAEYEVTAILPDGARRVVGVRMERDGHEVVASLRDVSAQVARRPRLEALAALGAAIQRETSDADVLSRVRDGLWDLGLATVLLRAEADAVRIVWSRLPAPADDAIASILGNGALDGFRGRWSPLARAAWSDGAAYADDWGADVAAFLPDDALGARARELVVGLDLSHAVAVRLDERAGVRFYLVVAGDWLQGDDVAPLRLFGAQVAAALDASRIIDDLSRRNAELTLLNDVAKASAQLDAVVLLEDALHRITDTIGADVTAAYLREGDRFVLVAATGMAPDSARRVAELEVGEGAAGTAVATLAPFVTADYASLGGRPTELSSREGLGPVASVPLVVKSQALGALSVGRRTARPFEDREVALLSAIGLQLGVAVENARLFSDVRRRLSDLESVHALALRIFDNPPGDVAALLEDGCRETARALSCRAAVLFLLDEDGRTLHRAAGFGSPLPPASVTLALEDDGLASDAFRRRAPAWTEDVTRDPRSSLGRVPGIPPLAMIAVPLASRAAARGLLCLADDAGRTFTDAELALANALAVELAVGLENAELYAVARRRVEELSLLNEMGRTVAASLDLDHVMRAGVEAARSLLDASRATVLLVDAPGSELRLAAASGLSDQELADARAAVGGGIVVQAIQARRVVVVEDAQADPSVNARITRRLGSRSLIAAPLLLRGEPVGALVVDEARRVRRFSDSEVEAVTSVANQLAVAIENARLYAEARGRLAELSTVIEVARVVSSSLDLEEVLGAGAEHLVRTLGASACTILLRDARAHTLRRAAARGAPLGEDRIPVERPSLARDALSARAPVVGRLAPVDDASAPHSAGAPAEGGAPASPAEGGAPALPARRGRAEELALLAVPLHVRDQPAGVALVARPDPGRAFTPGELSRAMAIASQLAVAVDNARLYSETRRRAEELGLLHEVGRSLVATLEIEQVLDTGVKNLARIVDCPEAYLALATDEADALEIRAATAALHGALGQRLPVRGAAAPLASTAFARRAPAAIEDALRDPGASVEPSPAGRAGRGLLALPLLVRDRTIGSAVIVDTRAPRRFTPAEVERAAAIANQLAVATENARLYEDLRKSYAELARAQRQLIQQERLAALGELSAVVAHEVRNPLGVIFNSLGSLRRMLKPSGDAQMLLDIVGEEADRLNRIVGDLLDFARPSTPQLRPEPFARVVEDAVQVALQNAAGVLLALDADGDLPPVPMDARLVRQAVLNVAVNAIQAMPRGGRLGVRVRREGATALLEIEDTGAGIPEEVRHRIFEPFFTTKASGTGLGLAVVKRIVEEHGGEVAVRTRQGEGTTFALRFPLAPVPAGRKEEGVA